MSRRELQEYVSKLRTIASKLLVIAPSASVKTSAIATELELRLKKLEALQ